MEKQHMCDCEMIHEEVVENTRSRMQTETEYMDLASLFKMFGDGTRVKILHALELNEMCAALADYGLLAQDCMLVLEHRTGEFGRPDERFEEWKERTYADTQIHFYLYASEAKEE